MGKRYETEKKIQGAPIGNKNAEKQSYQSDNFVSDPAKTNENLAKEYGVASSTISRSANFAKVVDILPTETKNIVLSGAEKISHADTSTILKMDKPTQKKFIKEKNGVTFLSIWQRKIPQ